MTEVDRTTRKRRETAERIAQAAFELFERDGYPAVTMEQIAGRADVARGTLYNHFPVKEAVLVHWMHGQLQQDLLPLMKKIRSRTTFAARMKELLLASARWWEAHRQYAAPYIRYRFQEVRDGDGNAGQSTDASDMMAAYVLLIVEAQKAREVRADTPPAALARYLHFLYLSALMAWLADAKLSLQAECKRALGFFMEGAALR